MEAIKEFLALYVNCFNVLIITAGIMLAIFIAYLVFSLLGGGSLKKINKILKNESGDDIIRNIESLHLSKRYNAMWEDYYTAYCGEDTVSLSSYLIKNDMLTGRNLFKIFSRVTAFIGFSVGAVGIIKIPVLLEAEKNDLICLFFVLLAFEVFLEAFYVLLEDLRKKRFLRLLEEFDTLSMRKLPGRAVSFEMRHIINKMNELDERIDSVRSGVNQLNARMDRQYKLLNKTENTEE